MLRFIVIAIGFSLLTVHSLVAWSNEPPADKVRFAVLSDPHLFDGRLGTTGAAFEAYLAQDRKMIRESEAILAAIIERLLDEDVEFVLVPGDLTKDGELASHRLFRRYIQILEDAGIAVYPIVGNHDINNPQAVAYDGNMTTPVRNLSPWQFKLLYWRNAHGRALYTDRRSLSYVVEPADGLWVIAIDSCKYDEQGDHPETGGAIAPRTLEWIEGVMAKAAEQGKTVFAMLHHGALEHFKTQSLLFGDYVIDRWRPVSKRLAAMGLRVVFTGHYHAQDIVKATWSEEPGSPSFLFDIETGSLVTAPVPYRVLTYDSDEQILSVESRHITEIDYDTGGVPFPDYAAAYLYEGLLIIAEDMLMSMFGLSAADAETLAPYAAKAFAAHYTGDEEIDDDSAAMIGMLLRDGDFVMKLLGVALTMLWTDPAPADNEILIDLTTGDVTSP